MTLHKRPEIAEAFRLALELAAEQEGATAPNPAVGCVLLDVQGKVLTAAAHLGAGQPHAEARAIQMACEAGLTARIHTVVVTLEPCNHHGRTGPCTAAIQTTPAREVWYAVADPNPTAAGGAAALAQSGLVIRDLSQLDHPDSAALQARATRILAPFASRIQRGRPFVTVKQALDPQGNMIPPPGQKTFTGPQALILAHRLRRRADAILTGSGTILADAPDFTVRHLSDIPNKRRWLCILDRRGRVGADFMQAAPARGLDPMLAQDPAQALQDLAALGCNEVLVEAGPLVTEAIRQSGLWDEWVLIRTGPPDTITVTSRQG